MRGGDLQHLAALTFKVVQVLNDLAHLIDHVACGDEKQLPRLGQLNRRLGAVHQGQAEAVLQAADTPTERRLGDEAPLCRLRKTARRRQGNQIFQPLGFDVHADS